MIEDIHEPVELYRTVFKAAHARNTSECFEDLLQRSGVDEQANIKTVRELRILEQQLRGLSRRRWWWNASRVVVILVGFSCLTVAILGMPERPPMWLLGALGATGVVFAKLMLLIKDVDARLRRIETQRSRKLETAWVQMAPLNSLYDWDIVARLVQRTVPRIQLDPYFARGRLDDLRDNFGWDDQFNQDCSVVFAHSGALNGNPFVVAQTLNHWMGRKTYHGSLQISWTEQSRDARGQRTSQTRYQTLHASVEKPFPMYGYSPVIIYGSEAAPDLSFSRTPSKLSTLGEGVISRWKKRRAVKQLEARSRKMGAGNAFTIMANREFDALFGATDRDHAVQFRLLFTPLAQQEMVTLLKDKEIGFGDRFDFAKRRMINLVRPTHLADADISADPAKFQMYELSQARKFFNDYHNDFFKSFFFGLAPILVIPIYQQHRSQSDIYKDLYARTSCFWEHESIANYFGEGRFQHPNSVTRNILKTESRLEPDGTQTVRVTAHGYKGIDRVDYVAVYGRDGRYHDVPVEWVKFKEVRQNSDMVVRENARLYDEGQRFNDDAGWRVSFYNRGAKPTDSVLRRSVFSALLPN